MNGNRQCCQQQRKKLPWQQYDAAPPEPIDANFIRLYHSIILSNGEMGILA